MAQKTQNYFLSSTIYQQVVPENSFWRKASEFIDWDKWSVKLSKLYNNQFGGNSNWPAKMMLKILLLQRVYNTSDRKTQEMCTQNLMVKFFLGLEVSEQAPDYSTISKFRSMILRELGAEFYEEFFQDILVELSNAGLGFGTTSVVDSTITTADVNTWKDRERRELGNEPRDKDASWTAKSRPNKKPTGNSTTYYYGYKTHAAVDIDSQVITAVIPTTASKHDGEYAGGLVDSAKQVHEVKELIADKGYDDSFLIHALEEEDIYPAIAIRRFRTNQVDMDIEDYWRAYEQQEKRQRLYKRRGEGERPFADQKINHGLGRCRYLGIDKYKMQSYLTAAAYNLKLGFKQLFDISLSTV